jgi:hypothetical protein
MYCGKCGGQIAEGAQFCSICGGVVEDLAAPIQDNTATNIASERKSTRRIKLTICILAIVGGVIAMPFTVFFSLAEGLGMMRSFGSARQVGNAFTAMISFGLNLSFLVAGIYGIVARKTIQGGKRTGFIFIIAALLALFRLNIVILVIALVFGGYFLYVYKAIQTNQ